MARWGDLAANDGGIPPPLRESRGTMMSAISAAPEMNAAGNECDGRRSADGATRKRLRGRIPRAIDRILLIAMIVTSAGVALLGATAREAPALSVLGATAAPTSAPALPAAPMDGVLTLVIPPGAAADQRVGGRGYQMPDVIQLTAGDTIVLRNDDTAPHMILYAFLMPGETHERTFTSSGSEVYSSGCGVHAASFLNFTTIFISE